MVEPHLPQRGLKWENGVFDSTPVWTIIPDIAALKSLVLHHLPHCSTNDCDSQAVDISFYAEGAFNKLYSVSRPHDSTVYILRVSLPVDPFFKTESEVATLAYVRRHTSIPV